MTEKSKVKIKVFFSFMLLVLIITAIISYWSYWVLLLLALEMGVVEFFMYGVKSIVGAKRNKKVIKVNWYYTFIMKMFFEE